jgi:ferrous iron transport protein A
VKKVKDGSSYLFIQVVKLMKRSKYIAGKNLVALTKMRSGYSGIVTEIHGGFKFIARLNSMGLIPGRRITKTSSMVGQGPVTIEVDRVQLAIGYGMASRIIINLDQVR